jgi:hypothetical protein
MPITAAEIQYRLSGGAANANANASLGGAKSSTAVPLNFFDDVTSAESAAGDIEYRCFYVHNNNGTLTLQNPVIWIQANTTGNRVAIGIGSSAVNGTEQTVANEGTAPTGGVAFSQPANKGAGLALGNIPPGQHRAVWIRRTIAAASPASNDTYTLRVEGDTAA